MSNFTAKDLFGCMTALVTPMNSSGEVNYSEWASLLDLQIAAEVRAVIVAGTTGESAMLSDSEFYNLLKFAVEKCEGTATRVIAQTGSINLQKVIEANNTAKQLGADAVMCVTPYYIRTTQKGLITHFETIADLSQLPVILYNVPSRTQNDLLPETTAVLAKHTNIIGLKEASSDANRVPKLTSLKLKDFAVVSGNDDSFLQSMSEGATGVISVASNVRPKSLVEICAMMALGDYISAKKLNSGLDSLYKVLSYEPNPIPVKYLMHHAGLVSDGIRMPLIWNDGRLPGAKAEINKITKESLK